MLGVKSPPVSKEQADAPGQIRRYLESLSSDTRRRLTQLRTAIPAAAPTAVDGFSYRIPNVRLEGRPLVWYAGWKQHCSMYPIGDAIRKAHAIPIAGYETSKGTIRFPLDQPLPVTLVQRLVKARIAELKKKARQGAG